MERNTPFSFDKLTACLEETLNYWHDDTTVRVCLGELRLVNKLRSKSNFEMGIVEAIRLVVLDCLRVLGDYSPSQAAALRRRYIEGETLQSIASDLQASVATAKRRSENSILRLARILYNRERETRDKELSLLRAFLPPRTYDELIGQEEAVAALVEQLVAPGAPWVTAIIGVGGIGKSSVADAVVREVLEYYRFERPIWIRNEHRGAQGSPLSLTVMVDVLQRRLEESIYGPRESMSEPERRRVWDELKQKPYLVVVDNLESEADTLVLLEFLRYTAEPTKFLLTSRSRLLNNNGIYQYPLEELDFKNAHRLLVDASRKLGPRRGEITPEITEPIYAQVGGHPLAIKLVANLLGIWPIDQILHDISSDRGKSEQEIYQPIFMRVWRVLTHPSQRTLLALSQLPPEGGTVEEILPLAQITVEEFWRAVEELTNRALLEVRGTFAKKVYGIHRLTYTFMTTGIPAGE